MEGTLRYNCNVVQDLDKKTLIKTLENTAKALNDRSREYFCFTLFIMGHGSKVGVVLNECCCYICNLNEIILYYDFTVKCIEEKKYYFMYSN